MDVLDAVPGDETVKGKLKKPRSKPRPNKAPSAEDDGRGAFASSGEEEEAVLRAVGGLTGAAAERAEARRNMVAFLRADVSSLCNALGVTQAAWGRELVAEEAEFSVRTTGEVRTTGVHTPAAPAPKGVRSPQPVATGGGKGSATWRAVDREALRKSLASFGLGRPDRVADAMRSSHGVDAVAVATAAFCRAIAPHAEPRERVLLERVLSDALLAAGCDVGGAVDSHAALEVVASWDARFGSFSLAETAARTSARRLRLLHQLGEVVAAMDAGGGDGGEAPPASSAAVWSSLRNDPLLRGGLPPNLPRWWDEEADAALLRGVWRHGYGAYAATRADPQLAHAFAKAVGTIRSVAHGSSKATAALHKRKRAAGGDEDDCGDGDGGGGGDGGAEGAAAPPSNPAVAFPPNDALTARLKRVLEVTARACGAGGGEDAGGAGGVPLSLLLPSHHEGDADEEGDEEAYGGDDGAGASPPKKAAKKAHRGGADTIVWTKRRRLEVVKAMMARGVPPPLASPQGDASADATAALEVFRDAASLPRSTPLAAVVAAASECEAEAHAVLAAPGGGKVKGKGAKAAKAAAAAAAADAAPPSPPDAPVRLTTLFTPASAAHLVERLELLTALACGIAVLDGSGGEAERAAASVGALTVGGARNAAEAPPAWWVPGVHDTALARGVLAHGHGAWSSILGDPEGAFQQPDASHSSAGIAGEALLRDAPPRVLARRLKLFLAATAVESADAPVEAAQGDDVQEDDG